MNIAIVAIAASIGFSGIAHLIFTNKYKKKVDIKEADTNDTSNEGESKLVEKPIETQKNSTSVTNENSNSYVSESTKQYIKQEMTKLVIDLIGIIIRIGISYWERWMIERRNIGIQNQYFSSNERLDSQVILTPTINQEINEMSNNNETLSLINILGERAGLFIVTSDETRKYILSSNKIENKIGNMQDIISHRFMDSNEYLYEDYNLNKEESDSIKEFISEPFLKFENNIDTTDKEEDNNMKCVEKIIEDYVIPEEISRNILDGDIQYILKTRIPFLNITNRTTITNLKDNSSDLFIKNIIEKIKIVEFDDVDNKNPQLIKLKENLNGHKDIFSNNYFICSNIVFIDFTDVKLYESELKEFMKTKPILNFYEYHFFKYLKFTPNYKYIENISKFLNTNGFELPEILQDNILPQNIISPVLLTDKDKEFVERSSYYSILENTPSSVCFNSPFTRIPIDVNEECKQKMKELCECKKEAFERMGKIGPWFENLEKKKDDVLLFENFENN